MKKLAPFLAATLLSLAAPISTYGEDPQGSYMTNCRGQRLYVNGPDVNCSDFCSQDEADRFFEMAGGPSRDEHDLDRDHDGDPCECEWETCWWDN